MSETQDQLPPGCYPALAARARLDPEAPSCGMRPGTLRFNGDVLRFEGAELQMDLPLIGLRMEAGGAANRLVFFSHAQHPGWSVSTPDRAILKDAALRLYPDLAAQARRMGGRRWLGWMVAAAVVALLGAGVWGLYLLKNPAAAAVADRVPVEWEQKLGDTVLAQYKLQTSLIENAALQADLEALAKPLLDALPPEDRRYPFVLHIAKDAQVNAFALPGGHVVLNSGLLLKAERPEEVLGVLAHEIAHVTRRHGLRQMVQTLGTFVVLDAFLGDVEGIVGVLLQNGAVLLTHKFSRDQEREADDTGCDYLVKAEIDPRGMVEFFEKLRAEERKKGLDALGAAAGYVSTHPDTAERITRLEERLRRTKTPQAWKPGALDYAAFKSRLREAQ